MRRQAFWGGAATLCSLLALTGAAAAQSCDVSYTAVAGDTLSELARRNYGDADQWSLIYYANITAFAGGQTDLAPGTEVFIPCLPGHSAPDPAPLQQDGADLRFVTATHLPLLTDQQGVGGGMLTEVINAVMESTPNPVPYAVIWDEDRSRHQPMLEAMEADMGFPWRRPDCTAKPDHPQCNGYFWSEPLFVLPVQLFVTQGGGMGFASDDDLEDKTLCLAEGDEAPWLDGNGRNLAVDGHVTITRAADFNACLDLLVAGDVDAVPQDIFSGVDQVYQRGLRGQVTALERPIGTESLHVVISKGHWRGTTHLYRVNSGLAAIKASGRYDEIINRHLGQYMAKIRG